MTLFNDLVVSHVLGWIMYSEPLIIEQINPDWEWNGIPTPQTWPSQSPNLKQVEMV